MMLGSDINSLETNKLSLEIELNALLKSEEKDEDKINELKSEILHLQKQKNRKLGTKEVQKQKELKKEKSRTDERIIIEYDGLKEKYGQISHLPVSKKNFLRVIEKYLNKDKYEYQDVIEKVLSR